MKPKTTFGLDFGTTNSALSVNQNGKVQVIDLDKQSTTSKTLRSVVYFDDGGKSFVGKEAIKKYVENKTKGRFMQSIKTFLPNATFTHTNICGNNYKLEDLIGIILKEMKNKGEEFLGCKVDDVVIGRPVIFSEDKNKDKLAESRLKLAAENAGFKNISFQLEPIAAALAIKKYLKNNEEQKILIGDLGGGTSDFAIIKIKTDKEGKFYTKKDDVLSVNGVYIGGDTFDSEIMLEIVSKYFGRDVKYKSMSGKWLDIPSYIIKNLCQWHKIPTLHNKQTLGDLENIKLKADDKQAITNLQNLINDGYGFMLFSAIEKAKHNLSSCEKTKIIFREKDLYIEEEITRDKFEEIIENKISEIKKCIDETLNDANIRSEEIDVVFTTGGSSYIPCIQKIFTDKFGKGKVKQIDAFTTVGYGLGMSAET